MKVILLILTFLIPGICSAQYGLIGKIQDMDSKPVPYANVVLLAVQDSKYVAGTSSNIDGQFTFDNLPNTQYRIEISFIGYDKLEQLVSVKSEDKTIEFTLQENETQLGEVLIEGKRKLFSRRADRLVVDVENSLRKNYGNAVDVLALTPGLRVQNDELKILSKPSVEVLINNRPSNLTGESLISFLETLSSQDIKTIEIFTIAPSHLDVTGNAGVINIILKKSADNSWQATIGSMYRKRTKYKASTNASFLYNKNKFSFSNSFYLQEGIYHQGQENSSFFENENWFTESSFDRRFLEYNNRANLAYEFSPHFEISMQYLYANSNQSVIELPFSNITTPTTDKSIGRIDSEGFNDQKRNIHAVNLNQVIALDTSGKQLTINLDYFNFQDIEGKDYNGIALFENQQGQFFRGENINNQKIKNQSASFNLLLPYSKAYLKLGGKYGKSNSNNRLHLANTGLTSMPIATLNPDINDFIYDEEIWSSYLVVDPVLKNEWSLSLGLRFESIKLTSESNSIAINNEKTLNNFLPTVFISKQIKEQLSLGLSYDRKITRPNFYLLTPNPWVTNPFVQVVGNPFLLPSISNNLELNFTYGDFLAKFYYTHTKDAFSQIPIANAEDKTVVFQFLNFPSKETSGVNLNHSWEVLKWWTLNNTMDINYGKYEYEDITQTGVNVYLSTSNDFILNSAKTLQMNITFWHAPKGVDEIWGIRPQNSLSSSLQYFLLDRKLTLGLRVNDLFRNQLESIYSIEQNVGQDLEVYYDSRHVSFSVNYNFGNSNIKTKNGKTGNADEIRRTGN